MKKYLLVVTIVFRVSVPRYYFWPPYDKFYNVYDEVVIDEVTKNNTKEFLETVYKTTKKLIDPLHLLGHQEKERKGRVTSISVTHIIVPLGE